MKAEELKKLVNKVSRAIRPNANDNRMYSCFKLCSHSGTLTITASCIYMTLKASAEADFDDFDVTVNAKLFQQIIQRLNGDDIKIESTDNGSSILITSGTIRSKLTCFAGDFIEFKEIDSPEFECKTNDLQAFVAETAHGLQKRDGISMIKSQYAFSFGDGLLVTTLDGYRVSVRNSLKGQVAPVKIVLEGSSVKDAASLFEGEVSVTSKDDIVVMKDSDGLIAIFKKYGGEYYDIAPFFEREAESVLKVDRKELIGNLRTASIMGDTVTCEVKPDEKRMILSNNSVEGNLECDIHIDTGADHSFKFGISAQFLIDALDSISDKEVKVEITSPVSPFYIRGDQYAELVMPVNI